MWSEASTKIIKNNFITVAVSGHVAMSRKDAEGEFIRDTCGIKLAGAGGNTEMLSASGKRLGNIYPAGQPEQTLKSLNQARAKFKQLPEVDRKPSVGERGPIDADAATLAPPTGGLILKVNYRTLTRDADGDLRHVVATDIPNKQVHIPWVNHFGETFEAQPDHLWLAEAEWRSLIPTNVKAADRVAVPAIVQDRMVRFHLVPQMLFGESSGWNPKSIRSRTMTLIVEEATADNMRMRLEGHALLGVDFATSERDAAAPQGYEPSLLGYLEYSTAKKAFTRFDLIALGDAWGKQGGSNAMFYRPGRHPLGVSFELVNGSAPAERIPPRAAVVYHTINPQYFGKGR